MDIRKIQFDEVIERGFRVVEMTSVLALLKVLSRDWGKLAPFVMMAIGSGAIALYVMAPFQRAYAAKHAAGGSLSQKAILMAFLWIMGGSIITSSAVAVIAAAIEKNLIAEQR